MPTHIIMKMATRMTASALAYVEGSVSYSSISIISSLVSFSSYSKRTVAPFSSRNLVNNSISCFSCYISSNLFASLFLNSSEFISFIWSIVNKVRSFSDSGTGYSSVSSLPNVNISISSIRTAAFEAAAF